MMRTSYLKLVALLPLLTAAVPTSPSAHIIPLTKRENVTGEDGVANVDFLRRQVSAVISKVDRGMKAFEENTGSPHPNHSKKARTKRATGTVPLTDESDGELWQGSVSVGTPPSTFTVDFDTGSSDFFLPGFYCLSLNCLGHKRYNTAASSTAIDQGRTYSLTYGDGSTVQGEVFTDSVNVGGISVSGQAVGSSTRYSTGFSRYEFPPDGLMGMGFVQISVFRSNPFFQTAIAQQVVTTGEFGVKLATSGSELFLGGVNTNLFTGSFTQIPVTIVGFWQVILGSANVDGTAAVSNLDAIIDTGTTLIVGDTASVADFYAQVPGSMDVGGGYFTFPCDNPPAVSLTFAGRAFTISDATFNLGPVFAGSPQCIGGIVGVDNLPFWVIGDVFLQNVYTSFDVTNRRVGFATLA